jgi:hypothetical protein
VFLGVHPVWAMRGQLGGDEVWVKVILVKVIAVSDSVY